MVHRHDEARRTPRTAPAGRRRCFSPARGRARSRPPRQTTRRGGGPLRPRGRSRAPPQPADLLRSAPGRGSGDAAPGARGRERRVVRAVGARGVGRRERARGRAVRRLPQLPSSARRSARSWPEARGDDRALELLRHGLLPAAQLGVARAAFSSRRRRPSRACSLRVEQRLRTHGSRSRAGSLSCGPKQARQPQLEQRSSHVRSRSLPMSSKSKTHEFGTSRSGSLRRARQLKTQTQRRAALTYAYPHGSPRRALLRGYGSEKRPRASRRANVG